MSKKIIIHLLIATILISLFASYVSLEISKEHNKYKAKLGEKFILEKDTLTIIDYSVITETFELSNGAKVNSSIVFNK